MSGLVLCFIFLMKAVRLGDVLPLAKKLISVITQVFTTIRVGLNLHCAKTRIIWVYDEGARALHQPSSPETCMFNKMI